MKKILKILYASIVILMTTHFALGCDKSTNIQTGAINSMKTSYIGRFSIAIPAEMNEADGSRSHQLRYADVNEKLWPEGMSNEKAREVEWNKFIATVKKLTPPKGKADVIIRMRDFIDEGMWAKAVLYYHNKFDKKSGPWVLLLDSGPRAVWIKDNPPGLIEEENKSNNAINNIFNIGKSYRVINSDTPKMLGDYFYLKHGAINLPYMWQEESDVRFEGHPLKLTLRVVMEMDRAYRIEPHGLMEKASAMIDSGLAAMAGVKVKRIRSRKRDVAGMPGEEVIDRLTTKHKTELDFGWEFIGKKDSGEYPTTRITMESPDGNLDEKLKIWDAVLDSMQPMFVRK